MRPLVTLTTDFGHGSPYVAQMKGVLLSLCRDVELVDITHGVHPQDVAEGAIVLADVTPIFPPETLHIAVIDPGVGTSRRLLYAEIGQQRYLLPDNGLLTLLAEREQPRRLISLENRSLWRQEVAATFHGRDILAPVAAHLCHGLDASMLGAETTDFIRLPWPRPAAREGRIVGQVIYIDSLGNLITNVTCRELDRLGPLDEAEVTILGKTICGIGSTYAAAPPGTLIALCDSHGRLEIATVNGSAARELSALPGTAVDIVGGA